MGLEPGYLVSKHVKLVRVLRRGGMGSVWVADHLGLQTQVAVKFISAGVEDPALIARFSREATAAARIKSPHVVQVHDHGVAPDGLPYIVMELLEGEDLSTRIKRVKRMSLDEVAAVVLQTCRVLTKAHRLDIIHRDIKPGNIFLVDNGGDIFVKLLDFGIAKTGYEPSEITGTGALVGTLCYMSPEQLLSSRRVDLRADLWSLGVVAYRAITGELPFKDDDGLGALCRALDSGIFFPPSEFVKDLPHEVDEFFERIFQRDPAARFESAREMADEFFLAIGQTLAIMPPSTSRVSLMSGGADPQPPTLAAPPESTRADSPSSKNNGRSVAAATEQTLSAAGAARSPKPAREPAGSDSERSASAVVAPPRSEDRGTLDGAPAQTLAGTASTPPPPPKAKSRRALVTVLALATLAGGAVAGLRFVYPARFAQLMPAPLTNGDRPAPAPTAAPTVEPAALPSGPVVTVVPSATADPPAPSASSTASATPSAALSAAPSAQAAASAAPSSSGKARVPIKKPEKDYGF